MSQDKDSSTEKQMKQTVTIIILIRTREYTEQMSRHPMPSAPLPAAINLPLASSPTQH